MYANVVLFGGILEERMFDLFSCLFWGFFGVFFFFACFFLGGLGFFLVCFSFYLFVLFLLSKIFLAPCTVKLFYSILRVFVMFADFRLTFSHIFFDVFLVWKTIQFSLGMSKNISILISYGDRIENWYSNIRVYYQILQPMLFC